MKEIEAKQAAETFRNCRWDVKAQKSKLPHIDWELLGKASNGGNALIAFSFNDMKVLMLAGQIATLKE